MLFGEDACVVGLSRVDDVEDEPAYKQITAFHATRVQEAPKHL